MSSGYTPVFGSIYQGTLCGKWPDAAVWASLLPLCDRFGRIDYTPEAIAALTGWPLELLKQGIAGLCSPDPYSRSNAEDGRRLTLIDPSRPWGWQVVNHAKYREKARLTAREADRVASGENRARMEARRQAPTPDDPRSPPPTHSQTQTQTQTKKKDIAPPPAGLDLTAWERWVAYRAEIGKPIKPASWAAQQNKLLKFAPHQAAVVEQAIAEGWQGLYPLKDHKGGSNAPREGLSAVDRVKRATTRAVVIDGEFQRKG